MGLPKNYLPEEDGGEDLGEWCGEAPFMSANMWIPRECLPNREAFLEAATVYGTTRTGESFPVKLAEEVGKFIVVPRHLFPWEQRWPDGHPKAQLTFEHTPFEDKITPRDASQQAAWDALSARDSGTLNLACGKGKTVLALKLIAKRQAPAIVVVNNSGLLRQWAESAKRFLGLRDDQIGIVQQKKAEWDKPLVLAMIHTLAKRADTLPMSVRKRFGTIVFDEVHHLSAQTFIRTAPLFFGNRYGLTATPHRDDGLELVYYAHVGEIFYSDLKTELASTVIFKGMPTRVAMTNPDILDVTGMFCAGKFYKFLSVKEGRNTVILNNVLKALKKGRKVLALTHAAAHPAILAEQAAEDRQFSEFSNYKVGCVTGDTSGPDRTKIIEDSDVTFATFQVAKEGLDVAALDTVFFLTPFKNWGSLQQGKGRVERLSPGKKDPLVVILDDYNIPPANAMCRSLRRSLRANGFTFRDLR